MQIIASSVQKAGDFFLHAGYMSSPANQTIDAAAPFVAGAFLIGILVLVSAIFGRPNMKFAAAVIVILVLYLRFSP